MRVPSMLVKYINWLLERDGEPIRFDVLEMEEDGRCRVAGHVRKLGVDVPVEIRFLARSVDPGRLLCEDIKLESSSALAGTVLKWLRTTILEGIREDVRPFGILLDLQ